MAGLDPAIQPQDPKRWNVLSWIVTCRNASFFTIPARASLGRDDGGCGVGPSADSRVTRLPFCRGFAGPFALRRRLTFRPGLAKREPGSFQTQISVFYDLPCLQHTALRGARDDAAAMRNAQSAFRADDEVFPEATKPLPGAVKRTWRAFHSALLRFWSIFPGFATRCMQKAGSVCGRGAIQSDCGKQLIAARVYVKRGMVNCIYFRSDFAPERAFFDLQVRKSAAG